MSEIRGHTSWSAAQRLLLGKKRCRSCIVNTKRRDSPFCTPCEKEMNDDCKRYVNHFYPGTYPEVS